MENLAVNAGFWRGKRVLVTGHTGFKGAWLCLWLRKLGASVAGFALPPASAESLFELADVRSHVESVHADIRNAENVLALFHGFRPQIVLHLAAQSLVRRSYADPVETFHVNIMGTVHLLEAVRLEQSCRVVVNVTSDKCYENREWPWSYRECDDMGGRDPYSSSKGCAELITAAYRRSFFEPPNARSVALASARAGNVIGGGDFSKDRIVPDFFAAARTGRRLLLRNPDAIRPWQHVLEPLSGYLTLAEKLWSDPTSFAQAWNFGPFAQDARPVRWIVERLNDHFDSRIDWEVDPVAGPHEARLLTLDSAKARTMLGWSPRWSVEQALEATVMWQVAYERGEPLHDVVMQQIASYEQAAGAC